MLKYINYIKESFDNKYKKGDKVIFNPLSNRGYYNMHKSSLCEIMFVYGPSKANGVNEYSIKTPSGASLLALEEELSKEGETPVQPPYIENQFKSKEHDIDVGKRVIVNGSDSKISFNNRKGTVKKIGKETYLIAFDEDDSQNQAAETMLVDKNFVKPLDEPVADVTFSIGDKVICVDKASQFFDKTGEVTNVWKEDNTCMVDFVESGDTTSIFMYPDQVKVTVFAKKNPVSFKREIPVKDPENKAPASIEEEDEDEVEVTAAPFKKEDLAEFSYKDFLLEEKISTHEDLMANKAKYEKELEAPELNPMKKIFIERSLRTAEIVDQYFIFLASKIAKDLPVYRTIEQIENADLLKTKTKVRAYDSKELTRKYSFDQGIIAYWKFKDAVVFRTI
jgi:hypothetical protein